MGFVGHTVALALVLVEMGVVETLERRAVALLAVPPAPMGVARAFTLFTELVIGYKCPVSANTTRCLVSKTTLQAKAGVVVDPRPSLPLCCRSVVRAYALARLRVHGAAVVAHDVGELAVLAKVATPVLGGRGADALAVRRVRLAGSALLGRVRTRLA